MESCSNQISVKQIKVYFIFDILQSSHPLPWWQLCTCWHSLNQLHEVVTWNAFQLTGVPFLTFLMHLSQSVVLWQGRGGIQKIAVFCKRRSPYYGKNSSNKQREMTVHHYLKTWRSDNLENIKNFVSSSTVAKTIKLYDKTGSHEDRHRKGRPRVTSAVEDMFICSSNRHRNCSPNKCFTEFK